MSSRFGRNKKRKLKDEISRLEATVRGLEGTVFEQLSLLNKAEHAIEIINRIAPKYITVYPEEIRDKRPCGSEAILTRHPNIKNVSLRHIEESMMNLCLKHTMHARINIGDGRTYACSYNALLGLDVEQISMRIAYAIKQEISKTEGGES